mmetsp:Transcript_14883/g.43457  ORF Transcript_14883/g.43457 Transcript_14883/m.43457 type:complete len:209 (+) Transcript_14883:60-686(+)
MCWKHGSAGLAHTHPHSPSEEEVIPCERQRLRRLAGEVLAVCRHLECLGVHGDVGRRGVVHHLGLADGACAPHCLHLLLEAVPLADLGLGCGGRHKAHACRADGPPEAAKHRPHQHGLRCGDGGVRIPHLCPRDGAALDHHLRLRAEHRRAPEADVGKLPHLQGADEVPHAMGHGGVGGVLRNVALDAGVVMARSLVGRQGPALRLHL